MYLFNPDNDLALANFTPNYTPPASATRMAEELAVLPIWYAGEDEGIVGREISVAEGGAAVATQTAGQNGRVGENAMMNGCDVLGEENTMIAGEVAVITVGKKETAKDTKVIAGGELNRSFLEAVKKVLPMEASLIPFSDIALYPHLKIVPWGWNPAVRRKLISYGAKEEALPSPEELVRLKGYSNRQHAVEILQELQTEEEEFCGESRFFTNTEELYAYLQSMPGNKVLKMPLSGSGKGLIWILGEITDKQRDWCRRVIREQGGVVAEPVLNKVQDFAMEFYLHEGQIRFAGYSMFSAAASGAYTGNELLSDFRIEEKLCKYAPIELLHRLRNSLTEKLSRRFPLYSGYAGVDMMICETPEGYRIQPCVEINMRMNMGMVARIFYERYMHPGTEGRFVVDYFKKPESALSFHEKMQRENPLTVKDKKISSGYLPLTPVTADTRYTAYVIVC
ncbi:hypothetical protein [uncultured Proteiniphilum sp.]|uniref:hypothetical protein n=1 Tax=uncultured Proteiniphilum sp. TaxID=497637 RepID=UPI00260AEBD3|nr:hypothetical protein [uncultured Proteiniphilum sp.]